MKEKLQEFIRRSCDAEQHVYDAASMIDELSLKEEMDPEIAQEFYQQRNKLAEIGMVLGDLRSRMRSKL